MFFRSSSSMKKNLTCDKTPRGSDEDGDIFSTKEPRVVDHIRARTAMDTKSTFGLDNFGTDVIDGMRINLQRGELGLVRNNQQCTLSDLYASHH